MYQKRIVVCLDVKDGRTTKGVRFLENKDIGDPVAMAEAYYHEGADEIVFYDITASAENRQLILPIVEETARRIFIPFCVGGGIGSLEEMRRVILAGAEKVSLNSQAVRNPQLITQGARAFGSQCVVLGMDAQRDPAMPSGYRVYINGGRLPTDWDAVAWAAEAVRLGAGEVVVNSIDADGTQAGYELALTRQISQCVSVPVVASGGGGTPDHLYTVLTEGLADAALIASMVHFGHYSLRGIKEELLERGLEIRRTWD